jgi:O-antigen/teichoic acid export membrane protein
VPLLCVATLLNCFATFAGIVYIIEKNSKKSLHTTFIGATINLILNFLLIRHWGLFGVAIGTAVGYLSVMLLRFKDFKKFFNLSLIDFNFILALLILIADSIIYMFMNNIIKYVISFICVFIILIISRKKITNIIKKLKRKLKKRK